MAAFGAHAATPTFNKDIAPILYQNCATCHRPGEVAPFALLTYGDAAKRADLLATITGQRIMPPWKAEPGYGSFANERRLSEQQIALIREWAKAGAPEGDAKDKPAPPVFPEGWEGGQPDKVLTMGQKFEVAADGPDQYRCFVTAPRSGSGRVPERHRVPSGQPARGASRARLRGCVGRRAQTRSRFSRWQLPLLRRSEISARGPARRLGAWIYPGARFARPCRNPFAKAQT